MKDIYKSNLKDLDRAISMNRLSLRVMGVWPDDQDIKAKFFKNFKAVPLMITSMFIFLLVPQMYALVLVKGNFILVIDNFMTSFPCFTCCIKLFFLWRNEEVLRPMVKSLIDDWLRPKSKWEREVMNDKASFAKIFTIAGIGFVGCSYLGFIIPPLFGFKNRIFNNITDYGERRLFFQTYYPFDYASSPNYELIHCSQLLCGLFIAMSISIPDNYFGALVYHLSAQYEVLGLSIEHFIQADDNALTGVKNKIFNRRLGFFVNKHVHLVMMTHVIEKSFTYLILTQVSGVCIMAVCLGCRILYMLGNEEEDVEILQVMNLGVSLLSLMLFMLVDCSASEILTYHSGRLHHHIYHSKWYLVPQQSTRDLVLMMLMSQKSRSLTAGKIFYLSMSTYCQIIKSIGGYISVLITASN